ncbi:MAG TPA: zinc-ribbon domain-containing protein, partial [Reyranellaceae bacterium]|nr:zinc-ribbon domain-containing protein [Reyranellaceae bacterium]
MQISCPNCGARYTVDPVALGPAGRTVQCFRCNHRWFEEVEPAPPVQDEYVPEERPVPDFVIRPQTYGAALPAIADS